MQNVYVSIQRMFRVNADATMTAVFFAYLINARGDKLRLVPGGVIGPQDISIGNFPSHSELLSHVESYCAAHELHIDHISYREEDSYPN